MNTIKKQFTVNITFKGGKVIVKRVLAECTQEAYIIEFMRLRKQKRKALITVIENN